ncbi:MAG: hypothetical protein SWE60_04825 [Thermodesulfobacteriota bacterium]|nr:hypothetical protein [Thermodesulfobacteriota bacterium]
MPEETRSDNRSGVDRGFVAMFLWMLPEDRLQANDNAFRTILELRDSYSRQRTKESKPE